MKLYAVSDGPPSLAVRMVLAELKIPCDLHNVDFIAGEHMTAAYGQLNPQKEIPVLDDNGLHLSESVAIMQYLCDKYRPDSALYPKEATPRALVNQRLCFNMAYYYNYISQYTLAPIFFDYPRTEHGLKKVHIALATFETYLQRGGTKYAAGPALTLADLALVAATLCIEVLDISLLAGYPLIDKWYAMFKKEHASLWSIAAGGLAELAAFEKNRPDLSHMQHPIHPVRK